jgi:hypothetical protein
MTTIVWILQIILGIKLLSVAYTHGLRQSQPTMQASVQRLGRLAGSLHYGIACLTLVGALGLTLPGILGLPAWVTPITAILLSILLLVSIFFHVKSREKPNIFVSLILSGFAAIIAYGHWEFTP